MKREDLAAAGYIFGWRLVRFIPMWLARWLFNCGADLASDKGRGMEQLRQNLSRVVGPENVTRQLVADSVRSYARYWLEAFRLPAMHKDAAFYQRLKQGVVGLEHLDASLKGPRGTILVLPHSGNWDMAGSFLVSHYGQFTTVAERLKPEVLFDAFLKFRTSLGFEVIALSGGQEPPFARLKSTLDKGGVVCLLAERDLSRTGVTVSFFGEPANMAAGPAVLAQETGAALHVAHSWFAGDGWALSINPPLEVTTVEQTTQRMADEFAANIKAHPTDWHMLQPQWNADIEKRRARRAEQAKSHSGPTAGRN